MSQDVLISYQGLPVFYRSYGQPKLEDFGLTAGFFEAIMSFSELKVGESLETISMSGSLFHFYTKSRFAFVFKEPRTTSIGSNRASRLLQEIADAFLTDFPLAADWAGDIQKCASFAPKCDRILQVHPVRRGFPVLFRIMVKPFFITPVLQVVPVSPENEETVYELQYRLKQSVVHFGKKNRSHLILQPFLLYLPRTKRIAYIFAFHSGLYRLAVTHLMCYIADESDWFAFYQLILLFSKRAQLIVPETAEYLQRLESNPLADDIWQKRDRIQDIIYGWADLNQYINVMHALLSEEIFKAGMASSDISEQQVRPGFIDLLNRVGEDFDKVLGAALSFQQVLFVSQDRQQVEQALSDLLGYYPHPSVTLWTEEPSDSLFVGTRPELAKFYMKAPIIVDLDSNVINGGTKNEFCATLLGETLQFATEMSVSESHIFFQGKISAIFTLLKAFLEILTLDEEAQQQNLREMLRRYPEDSIELVYQIGRNVNKLLAKVIRQARTQLKTAQREVTTQFVL